jgi:hypothetical protein
VIPIKEKTYYSAGENITLHMEANSNIIVQMNKLRKQISVAVLA